MKKRIQDKIAILIEDWFTNICVNDMFSVEFGRQAPCKGKH